MLIHADCLEALRNLPDNSVDSVVTDPPYGLSFMGKKWDYDVPSTELWAECLRVLKPGGHLLAFAGTRTQHRMAVRIEDAGFEIRDMIAWVYGSGFPKSLNIGKQNNCEAYQGWGTALKPALEPICLARKPIEGTVAANVLKWGTGAINIDGCRVGSEEISVHTDPAIYSMTPHKSNLDYRNHQGRFPANLIHDGSDEVVECFPNDAARFFYCAKASKAERNDGNHHPTVKPLALMRYLVRLVTPPNGTVLDPFLGSGTTAIAAVLEGRDWIGIEREAEYCDIAEARIAAAEPQQIEVAL